MDIENAENKNGTTKLAKEKEMTFGNEEDGTDLAFRKTIDKPLEKENMKNPMLLSPIIRCVLKFLNFEDIKNCRFVSREWGSAGKVGLARRTLISFRKPSNSSRHLLPVDFYSCFLDSTSLFCAFAIYGEFTTNYGNDAWTVEELTKFFDKQQKYIKELTFHFEFPDGGNILSSWISKSPIVQNDTKFMTKLEIYDRYGTTLEIPLHLVAYIKDLSLKNCKINLEAGIKICPLKLKFSHLLFYQDGIKLDRVRMNNIVDLCRAKEVSLYSEDSVGNTKYVVDLKGSFTLEKLILYGGIELMNEEKSQLVINQLGMTFIPFPLQSQMKIKELCLSQIDTIDLFTIPNSVEKLALKIGGGAVICSQPILLENLKYLNVSTNECSFFSHFMNCPKLTHLKLYACYDLEMKSLWMPKNIKTVTLIESCINWVDDSFLNVEKLIVKNGNYSTSILTKLYKAKIGSQVDDVIVYGLKFPSDEDLVNLLKYRKDISLGKRLYIVELTWGEEDLEDNALKEYVDVKSSFYVFENGEKGRAVSEKVFCELIPKQ